MIDEKSKYYNIYKIFFLTKKFLFYINSNPKQVDCGEPLCADCSNKIPKNLAKSKSHYPFPFLSIQEADEAVLMERG